MTKSLRPAALLPSLTTNKKYLKKLKFLAKHKQAVIEADRHGGKKFNKKGEKMKKAKSDSKVVSRNKKKSTKLGAKKTVSISAKKKKRTITQNSTRNAKLKGKKGIEGVTKSDTAMKQEHQQTEQQMSQEEIDRLMIERAIRGEDGTHDASLFTATGGCAEEDGLLHYPCLPFLEDYAEQKRSEVVSADTLLHNAHVFFKDLGNKESAMRRAAAKRLRELKDINRRGGDKDGFRYVVPRNVKEVVQKMMQNAEGADATSLEAAQLTSTFGGDDEKTASERPVHRKKRRNSRYSDFYQFQVSKRWTRNAENFLNKGRAHRSMFEATKPQRSIKKF